MAKDTSYILAALNNEFGHREQLIARAYLHGLELNYLDRLLGVNGYGKLYVRKKSDAIWKYIIQHHVDLNNADMLFLDTLKNRTNGL